MISSGDLEKLLHLGRRSLNKTFAEGLKAALQNASLLYMYVHKGSKLTEVTNMALLTNCGVFVIPRGAANLLPKNIRYKCDGASLCTLPGNVRSRRRHLDGL